MPSVGSDAKIYSIGKFNDVNRRFYIEGDYNHVGINRVPDLSYSLIIDSHDLDASYNNANVKSLKTIGDVDISGDLTVYGELNVNGGLNLPNDLDISGALITQGVHDINTNSDLEMNFVNSSYIELKGDAEIDGNLGIGVSPNASYALSANGSIHTTSNFRQEGESFKIWNTARGGLNGSEGRALTHALNGSTSNKANSYLIVNEDDDFEFGTQIGDSGCHVGIGTTPDPSYNLNVNGSTQMSGDLQVVGNATIYGTLRVESDSAIFGGTTKDTSMFYIDPSGAVAGMAAGSTLNKGGSVAMGVNDDGEGNASIAFNHFKKKPDRDNGTSGRIACNVQSTSDAQMVFSLKPNTSQDVATDLDDVLTLENTTSNVKSATVHGTIDCTEVHTSSDINLKTNIKDLEDPLTKICKINGYNYTWKDDKTSKLKCGVIAQWVENHIPEVVITNEKTGIKSVDYNGLIPYLIESVKTIKSEIDIVNENIEKLENSISLN